MGLFSKIKEGLKKTRKSVMGQIDSMLRSYTKIDEDLFEDLEELLVMGDVGVPTAERICEELRMRVMQDSVTNPALINGYLQDIVAEMLEGGEELDISTSPSIILVIGVNGVGKTTTIGKMAKQLSDQAISWTSGHSAADVRSSSKTRAATLLRLSLTLSRRLRHADRTLSSATPQEDFTIKSTLWTSLQKSTALLTASFPTPQRKSFWCLTLPQVKTPSIRRSSSAMQQVSPESFLQSLTAQQRAALYSL